MRYSHKCLFLRMQQENPVLYMSPLLGEGPPYSNTKMASSCKYDGTMMIGA